MRRAAAEWKWFRYEWPHELERRAEIANRNFRKIQRSYSACRADILYQRDSLAGWLGIQQILLFAPERRFTLDSSAEARAGREFADDLGPFATLRGSLRADWLPRAKATITKCRHRFARRDRRQSHA